MNINIWFTCDLKQFIDMIESNSKDWMTENTTFIFIWWWISCFFNNIFKRVIYETNHSEWNYNCLRSISTLVVSHYNAELVAQRSKPLNLNILALYKYCIILLQYYIVMFIHFTLILYGTLRGCIVGIIYHYEVRVHIISYWVHVTSRYCPVC